MTELVSKRVFEVMARERVDGVLAVASPLLRSHRAVLAQLSLTHRLAGMFGPKEHVEVGGLMCYFPDQEDLARRAATYIDKILRLSTEVARLTPVAMPPIVHGQMMTTGR